MSATFRNMPANVKRFVLFAVGAIVVPLPTLMGAAISGSLIPAASTDGGSRLFAVGLLALFAAALVNLVWCAAWQRRHWARVTLAVVYAATGIAIATAVRWALLVRAVSGDWTVLLFVLPFETAALFESLAVWCVFTGDARPWFRTDLVARHFD